MRKFFIAAGLIVERITEQKWLVFVVATLAALIPATLLYDAASTTRESMDQFSHQFSNKLFTPPAVEHQAKSDAKTDAKKKREPALAEIIQAWPKLAPEAKTAILTIVHSAQENAMNEDAKPDVITSTTEPESEFPIPIDPLPPTPDANDTDAKPTTGSP